MADYHMLGYIHESPAALRATLQENQNDIRKIAAMACEKQINKVVLSGLGSSYTSAIMAMPLFQRFCRYPTVVINSEETAYYAERWIDAHSLVVVVSRSGERGAVVDTLNLANRKGGLGVAVTGMADSLLAQNSTLSLITREGAEITFPKTKSVTACTGVLMRLALELVDENDQAAWGYLNQLDAIPGLQQAAIQALEPQLKELLPSIKGCKLLNVAGTCSNHGVALEAAIKVQEASFIPTRGDSTAGLLQGPVGALNEDWLVMVLVMKEDLTLSIELLKLVRQFGARSMAVFPQGLAMQEYCDHALVIPQPVDPYLAALIYLPAIQLLTYYWTVERGMNPDAPSSMDSILKSILPPGRQEPELKNKKE